MWGMRIFERICQRLEALYIDVDLAGGLRHVFWMSLSFEYCGEGLTQFATNLCSNNELPSGELPHFAMERSTIFNGKIHYFYGHFQ